MIEKSYIVLKENFTGNLKFATPDRGSLNYRILNKFSFTFSSEPGVRV